MPPITKLSIKKPKRLGIKKSPLRLLVIIILVLLIVIIAIALAYYYQLRSQDRSKKSLTPEEELSQVVGDFNSDIVLDVNSWVAFEDVRYGYTFKKPADWDSGRENLRPGDDSRLTQRIAIQSRGSRYFREPREIIPLLLEVAEVSAEDAKLLRPFITTNAESIQIAGQELDVEVSVAKDIRYIIPHPDKENITLIFTDSVGTISGISDQEKQGLRATITNIIKTLKFKDLEVPRSGSRPGPDNL